MSECQGMKEQQLEKRDRQRRAFSDRILEAAKSCFLNYGFKRTSMEDIATKVGISRPALYLHFQNKKAIFRALVEHLNEETLRQAEMALKEEGDVCDRILQGFERRSVELFALVCDSTHGEELIDINGQVAADICQTAQHKFVMMLTQVLQQAETNGEIQLQNLQLDARQAAELLINSTNGLKEAAGTTEDYRLSVQRLIKMFEKAVVNRI